MPNRSDPEKHRAQVKAANNARKAAIDRLIKKHPIQFDNFYREEANARGVIPTGRRR